MHAFVVFTIYETLFTLNSYLWQEIAFLLQEVELNHAMSKFIFHYTISYKPHIYYHNSVLYLHTVSIWISMHTLILSLLHAKDFLYNFITWKS